MPTFREAHPGPWVVVEIPAPGYVVKDAGGNELAFVYASDGRHEVNARFTMSMAEAKSLADAIAKLGS